MALASVFIPIIGGLSLISVILAFLLKFQEHYINGMIYNEIDYFSYIILFFSIWFKFIFPSSFLR